MKYNKLAVILLGLAIIGLFLFLDFKADDISFGDKQNTVKTLSDTHTVSVTSSLVGKKAPDFNLTTIDGDKFRLSDMEGKTVILFGMAGWCGTCIPEGRILTQIRKEYTGKGIEVIGVAFTRGDNEGFLKEFRELGTIDIPLALDTDNIAQKYRLIRLETTYIINKEGVIVYKDEHFTDYENYKRELDKVI